MVRRRQVGIGIRIGIEHRLFSTYKPVAMQGKSRGKAQGKGQRKGQRKGQSYRQDKSRGKG